MIFRLPPKGGLLKASAASLLIKMLNVSLGFALAVLLARMLGAEGYGEYSFVYATVMLLAVPVQMGMPQFVVRETARADLAGAFRQMRAVWLWAHKAVTLIALLALASAAGTILLVGSGPASPAAFWWGLTLLPLIAFGNVRGAALRGLGHVVLGQAPELVLRPLFLILALLAAWLAGFGIAARDALMLHAGASVLAFAIGGALLARRAPRADDAGNVRIEHRAWLVSAAILGAMASLQVVNSNFDLVMLGVFRSEAEVGIYKVATTGAGLAAFGLQALNTVVSPRIARHYAADETKALQHLLTASARLILGFALAAVAAILLFGDDLLAIAFGEPFRAGYAALAVLALGQLANAAFGSVSILLSMSGHERVALAGFAASAAINVVLNLILIPPYGLEGAAAATAISVLVWNAILWRQVRTLLGFDTTALGLPLRRQKRR